MKLYKKKASNFIQRYLSSFLINVVVNPLPLLEDIILHEFNAIELYLATLDFILNG